jgi:methylenetetrahydrofolate reductase (NADPH)
MFPVPYLIEILTPKKGSPDTVGEDMQRFAERYSTVLAAGCGVSVPDNPMGQPRYGALDAIQHGKLPVRPDRMVLNLNTFHTKAELDRLLTNAAQAGLRYLLVVRGDGGPQLPKLDPQLIGGSKTVTTSSDLIRYVHAQYPGLFITGAGFNQYNPKMFETEKLRRKIEAGAKFVITQPVIGRDSNVEPLKQFDIPVVIEAWMSKNVALLLKSVRSQEPENVAAYDPVSNLKTLHELYPDNCVYLSMLGFKQDWRVVLPRLGSGAGDS